MTDSNRIELCSTSDVPEGEAILVEKNDLELAVYNVDGSFFVSDDHCTHGPGSLSDGFLDGFEIECDFHGGCFDVRTGEVTQPPCTIPIKTYTVSVVEDQVCIDL